MYLNKPKQSIFRQLVSLRSLVRAKTIRSQILFAFLCMAVITASLAYFAIRNIEREGVLVDRTYDRSLMSINFARAAAADFNALQAAVARQAITQDDAARKAFDNAIVDLEATMDDDLAIAVQRAQSGRVVSTANEVSQAIVHWKAAQKKIAAGYDLVAAWPALDRQASIVARELDLLVNYTAGDGFTYRQSAHATILSDKHFNIAATVLAILVSGSIAWLLSRRVVLPIKKASEIASKIADGDLGVMVPIGNADELGALLAAMEAMRGAIQASMEREVELRQSAQMRLADALEGSCEGIVVVGADGRIALANAQASSLLDEVCDPLKAGDSAVGLVTFLARRTHDGGFEDASTWEVRLSSYRWLRVSKSDTQEGGNVFVYSDISLFKSQQADLKSANLWLDSAVGNLSYGLLLFDSTNRLMVYNQRFCDLLAIPANLVRPGMSAAALVTLAQGQTVLDDSSEFLQKRIEQRAAAQQPFDTVAKGVNGRMLAISHRLLDDNCWMATYEDVTDRLQAAEKIAYLARHDALTGLPNRAFFAERIDAALTALNRGECFALLCLDLDRFKEVNDTLGHPIGDGLLRVVAERLRYAIRGSDVVARLGGDEFAIIQSNVDAPEDVRLLAERIVNSLNRPFVIAGNPVAVGVSIGISMAPIDGRSYDKLLKNADMALYRAKGDGRNCCRFFEREMDERQQARRLLELDLRDALAGDQFELDYQPIFEIAKNRISGFEALVRWRHPERGLLPPSDFIPIAEELGLITQIGGWVLQRACRDATHWPEDVSVAVNVSAAQLRSGGLYDVVTGALKASGVAPPRLILEITESVLIANAQGARTVLNRFKALGIQIAMDDFGTGYSSLSYLRSFPFDHVKIDKSFIREITTCSEAASIVRAIIALCLSLGMRTTAEGVETAGQLALLTAEGCEKAQGFFFSKPVPARAVPRLLAKQKRAEAFSLAS